MKYSSLKKLPNTVILKIEHYLKIELIQQNQKVIMIYYKLSMK